MRPEFITFTGVDCWSDPAEMAKLSAQYPIEWGILFASERRGLDPRFPALATIEWVLEAYPGLRYAAHLCGHDARAVLESGKSPYDALLHAHFTRVQINTVQEIPARELKAWGDALSVGVIAQCRGAFPNEAAVEWLFDKSGGRGVEQSEWPRPLPDRRVGFAGGLRPDNVAAALGRIAADPRQRFWLDLESGVRDELDRFSLAKCRAVCQAVYGAEATQTEAHRG